jgi:hypothetical protein
MVFVQLRPIQLIIKGLRIPSNNSQRLVEKSSAIAAATGNEAILVLFQKISIFPNDSMTKQGERLSKLRFDDRAPELIDSVQNYYRLDEE